MLLIFPQAWSLLAMHGFTVIRICVKCMSFWRILPEQSKASTNSKKGKKKTTMILYLSLKAGYSALKARKKHGRNVWLWASSRPELKFSHCIISPFWASNFLSVELRSSYTLLNVVFLCFLKFNVHIKVFGNPTKMQIQFSKSGMGPNFLFLASSQVVP